MLQIVRELPPTELKSWEYLKGIKLTSWESTALLNMFSVFNKQLAVSKSPKCQNPLLTEEEKSLDMGKRLTSALRTHSKKR